MEVEPPRTMDEALALAARRRGSHPAIVEDGRELAYDSFDARASAIAAQLLRHTNGASRCVCQLIERRVDAMPALFGSMRARCEAVPLDLDDPDDRLRAIVAACAPAAILAAPATLDRARALAPPGCAVLDSTSLPGPDRGFLWPAVAPDDRALCHFTSGSTGAPKGVLQTHRNLVRYAGAYVDALRVEATDRHSWMFKLSFSASVPTAFGMIVAGATLVAYDLRARGVSALPAWLARERVSVLHAPLMALREMLERMPPGERLDGLRAVQMAGQALFEGDLERLRERVRDGCRIVYRLASTEHNMTTFHVIPPEGARSTGGVIAVGRPPLGTRIEIVRDDGTAAAIDEVGEVVVVCAHVSPGYRGASDTDAAAFAPDPDHAGMRRFRSGDLGRLDADGMLTLAGRRGSRVRVLGHTVDLIEVESALARCIGVREVAVTVPSGDPDRLVAYVVAMEGATITAASLRRDLATRLPRYMLPGAFVFLDALPVNRNGKADRLALAARGVPVRRTEGLVPPRDERERAIAAIFEDMLAVSPVGRDDDFFLLGGDSLALADLQARIRDACGVALAMFDVDMTPAGLAAQVRREGTAAPAPLILPLREGGDAPPLFFVHGRLGQAPVSPRLVRLLGEGQPAWAIRARGLDGVSPPHDTIEAMALDYLVEIRKLRPSGPYLLGSLCAGAFVVAEMARRLKRQGEHVLPLLFIDPPETTFPMSEAAMTDERVMARLRNREKEWDRGDSLDDPGYARASIRTAVAFERAIANHRPRGYGGPVVLLASGHRASRTGIDQIRRLYPRAERIEIGGLHSSVIDPDNPALAQALSAFLARVREEARALRAS